MDRNEELRAAQRAIVAALSQHAAYSYRASSAVVNRINEHIDQLARELTASLAERLDSLTQAEMQAFLSGKYTTPKLKAMKAEIDGWGVALDQAIKTEWDKTALALAGYEATYIGETMHKALDGLPSPKLKPDAVLSKAKQTPLFGKFVDDMLTEIAPDQKARIFASLRQGIAAGQSNSQIIRALRGTSDLRYQDGLMQAAKRDVERVVRTARNHVSSTAYDETYDALGVQFVVRVAALEGRTCVACAALDGKVYKRTDPKPAATLHPNCRCQYAPAMDGELIGNRPFVRALKVRGGYRIDGDGNRVPRPASFRSIGDMTKSQRTKAGLEVGQTKASTTYSSWFANQDATYQKEWLGPTRYKLYKEGKMPIERFSDPMKGKEYTIDQLRQRDAETFKAVFGS